MESTNKWRKTDQYLPPGKKPAHSAGKYDIYPSFNLGEKQIISGFESIAEVILKNKIVLIDGYVGVFFDQFRNDLDEELKKKGHTISWKSTSDFLK